MNTYFTKENDGDVVLFLHGWGADSDAFGALTMQLTNYKCISIDFWGFGKSSEPNDANGWSVVDYANNLAEFMTEHNLQYCNIVAHSFGGRVAIVLSALYPHLVKRLVLLSSAGLRRFSLKRFCKVRAYKFKKFLVRHNILSASRLIDSGSQDYKNCSVVMKKTFIKVVNQDLSRYARLI
ncbi:MAG: alpha/beta hydrolase, partial [Clostridia bacterium]